MRVREKRRNNPNIWIESGSIFWSKFGVAILKAALKLITTPRLTKVNSQISNASTPKTYTTSLKHVQLIHISRVLIGERNLVEAIILTSLGSPPLAGQTSRPGSLDIVELSNLIISGLKRKLITETTGLKYWGAVDTKLADVRATHPNPAKQSKWIKQRILDPDLVRYKHVELEDVLVFLPCL
ncbi:hypothetical protein B0H19DRAFT_1237508 [Mycena capillaripes]|nr:hypothetical protein B0H19DRAFT_1237508 [Mycena capillaripes]